MSLPVTVTFDRIGRDRPAPLAAAINTSTPPVAAADRLAEAIYSYARPHLASRDVDVQVGLNDDLVGPHADGALIGEGYIFCGFQVGARFTVTVAPAVAP